MEPGIRRLALGAGGRVAGDGRTARRCSEGHFRGNRGAWRCVGGQSVSDGHPRPLRREGLAGSLDHAAAQRQLHLCDAQMQLTSGRPGAASFRSAAPRRSGRRRGDPSSCATRRSCGADQRGTSGSSCRAPSARRARRRRACPAPGRRAGRLPHRCVRRGPAAPLRSSGSIPAPTAFPPRRASTPPLSSSARPVQDRAWSPPSGPSTSAGSAGSWPEPHGSMPFPALATRRELCRPGERRPPPAACVFATEAIMASARTSCGRCSTGDRRVSVDHGRVAGYTSFLRDLRVRRPVMVMRGG